MAGPYPRPGDSEEVRNLVEFARMTNGAYITSTTDHSLFSKAGFISWHRRGGTNGNGRAIDIGGPKAVLTEVFKRFLMHKDRLHELIYTPMGYSVKDGKTVGPIAASGHLTHVHVSVPLGTRLPVSAPLPIQKVKPMFDPPFQVAAWCHFKDKKGPGGRTRTVTAAVDPTGHVYCEPGDGFIDAPANHPDYWKPHMRAADIQANDKPGYSIQSTEGNWYHYPDPR